MNYSWESSEVRVTADQKQKPPICQKKKHHIDSSQAFGEIFSGMMRQEWNLLVCDVTSDLKLR